MNHQGFLVLFRSTSDTIVAGMLLSLAYLKAIQWLAPFKDPALNRIKETSIWQIFFVFMIALLIKMDDIDSDFLVVRICKNHEPGAWVEVIELKLPKPARPGETVFRYSESKTVETVWAVRDLRRAGWNERH